MRRMLQVVVLMTYLLGVTVVQGEDARKPGPLELAELARMLFRLPDRELPRHVREIKLISANEQREVWSVTSEVPTTVADVIVVCRNRLAKAARARQESSTRPVSTMIRFTGFEEVGHTVSAGTAFRITVTLDPKDVTPEEELADLLDQQENE